MKQLAILTLAISATFPVFAGTDVGVSIHINQPGAYGRIDLGNYPPPAVVYTQPVLIIPPPVSVYQQPVYVYVPLAHQQRWGQYCGRYSACGLPVYFVQERWYQDEYVPRYWDCKKHKCKLKKYKGEKAEKEKNEKFEKHDRGDRYNERE